jgi:hypothetical protein
LSGKGPEQSIGVAATPHPPPQNAEGRTMIRPAFVISSRLRSIALGRLLDFLAHFLDVFANAGDGVARGGGKGDQAEEQQAQGTLHGVSS